MLGACTPKQSRRFFSQEAAAFCCIGFPFGGSCQWPRPLTDEGQVCHSHPFAGSYNKRAPHPALRGYRTPSGAARHLPRIGGVCPQGGRLKIYFDIVSGAFTLNIVRMLWMTPRTARQSAMRPC